MDKEFLTGLGVPEDISEIILERFAEEAEKNQSVIDGLQANMDSDKAQNQQKLADLSQKLEEAKVGYLTDLEILKAGGKNLKAIKALLNMEDAFIDEDGLLAGVDISAVKEGAPYLFNREEYVIEGAGTHISGAKRKKADPKNMDFETYKKWRAMI